MKILITFENGSIPIHCIDFIRVLIRKGHEVHFLKKSSDNLNDPFGWFPKYTKILTDLENVDQYDVWFYDVTSWEGDHSIFLSNMESYNGKMACINYEDGYGFFTHRVSDVVINKTLMFMNNTLRKDKSKYDSRIANKLVLATSYISNSQDFKSMSIPFRNKLKRAIFTGSITGFSESGDPEEIRCRIKVPMAVINGGVPCFYKIYQSDPNYKKILDEVPLEYRTIHLHRPAFLEETINSMIILSLRGNGYTVNRFFEGLAAGGLVFSTKFNHAVDFVGCGEAGVHYVEIMWDGSDVVEKAKYYFDHLDEAEKIATNGRKLWEEYSMLDENGNLPPKIVQYYVDQIRNVAGIEL